ncbi:MAG: TraC family protein [Candidatus Pacebacteria bacterium]|nr:TraC family protein [Candidatus Paceibacterota bacterium]
MPSSSTQQFLQIEQIREGVVYLKNKSLRGVLNVSSQNFALKSAEEQEATIFQFQNFLNSLDFPLEIVIQSRILNITGYIDKVGDLAQKQQNELLKIQTEEYQKFIKELIAGGQILSKTFYVLVPFYVLNIPGTKSNTATPTEDDFQRAKSQLWQRMEFVALGLRRCGLQCSHLNTPELIELFWSLFHPEESEVGYYPEIPPEITK